VMGEQGPNPFFTRHAASYAASESFVRGRDLALLLEDLDVRPGERALDVATGTGHTAFALAARGAQVTGLDPTPAMLAEARRLAAERGATAIRWVEADVDAMPFEPGSFDVVTCRRAFHHFPDAARALRAMLRLLVPGGRLAVSDRCPTEATWAAANACERLRDPSHVEALSEARWRALLEAEGVRIRAWHVWVERGTFRDWLQPLAPEAPEAARVRAFLAELPAEVRDALTGGAPDGWLVRRLVFVAERPRS
jgi:SAM-dependent methyltransferase